MRYIIIVLILLNFSCQTKETVNQTISTPDIVSVEEDEYDEGETGCTYIQTGQKPANTHPFDKSDKVELVSYGTRRDSYRNDELIRSGKFTVPEIQQRVRLNKTQRDSLFSILFKLKKIRKGNVESIADCYNPRHSIVFYQGGQAIAFLEVCFECNGTRQTKELYLGEFCDEKWCILQQFFKVNGADFGLINEICDR